MAGDVRCQTIAGDNLLLLLKTRTTQYISFFGLRH